MSKETVTIPASAIKDMVEGSGRIKRPRPESETQVRPNRSGNIVDVSTDIHDTLTPAGDVDEQIVLNEAMMRDIIGTPIESDEVSVHTSHNAPNPGSEAPDQATASNVGSETTEPDTFVPVNGNDKSGARPSIAGSTKTSVDTASIAPPARATHSEDSEPSVQTVLTTDTEPREIVVPTPQTATTLPNGESYDTRNSRDTAHIAPTLDTDPTRRTVKQRRSDLDEYSRRYMKIPRIEDRKPVFVSRATRDRLDRIMRLLGDRGMSVSGLIENIALHHLAVHEPDIEHWRKM